MSVSGQTLRHVEGWSMGGAGFGVTPQCQYYYVNYNYFFGKNFFLNIEPGLLQGMLGLTSYQLLGGCYDVNYTFFKCLNDRLFFNGSGGMQTAAEKINNEIFGSRSAFVFGIYGGGLVELYLVRKIALQGFIRQYLQFNSNVNNTNTNSILLSGVGIKICLN